MDFKLEEAVPSTNQFELTDRTVMIFAQTVYRRLKRYGLGTNAMITFSSHLITLVNKDLQDKQRDEPHQQSGL